MNIDTIKKYKNEFNHFVNGGKLLWARARDYKLSWLKATGNHQEFFNTNDEYYIYIIDDEYVEFRKALAEGKTIQLNGTAVNGGYGETWNDCDKENLFIYGINTYRIKPDEPKFKIPAYFKELSSGIVVEFTEELSNNLDVFSNPERWEYLPNYKEPNFKVGDFVRYIHTTYPKALEINNINGNRYYFTNSEMSCLKHELEPWTPVKNEWCWFWDKCTPHRPTLRQYDIFPEGYSEENMFHDSEQNPFDFCEPFLNSRPSYLKDK